jgi:hypothetical protein
MQFYLVQQLRSGLDLKILQHINLDGLFNFTWHFQISVASRVKHRFS